jgi:hypothetical protein
MGEEAEVLRMRILDMDAVAIQCGCGCGTANMVQLRWVMQPMRKLVLQVVQKKCK